MICEQCGETAHVHITEVESGKTVNRHLCQQCASADIGQGATLRLKVCPRCDYSLVGSPAAGVCPECGRQYDTSQIYLYGNALGERRKSWNATLRGPRQIISGGLFTVAMVLPYWWLLDSMHFYRPFGMILAGWFVFTYLMAIWRGMNDQGSGVAQAKFTDDGVRQGNRGLGPLPYEANEKGKLVPWRKVKEVQFAWRGWYGEIRLSNQRGFFQLNLYRPYVHTNFACTKAEFIEVRKRVRQWLVKNNCKEAMQYMVNDPANAKLPGGAMNETVK
jgi:hypothetical protein